MIYKKSIVGLVMGLCILIIIAVSCANEETESTAVDSDYKIINNYKPPPSTNEPVGGKVAPPGSEKGNKYFDPSAKSSSTDGKLSTKLGAKCEFNSVEMKLSCEAQRTSMQSTLHWTEDLLDNELSGEKKGVFEVIFNKPVERKILIILEECLNTACNKIETVVEPSD